MNKADIKATRKETQRQISLENRIEQKMNYLQPTKLLQDAISLDADHSPVGFSSLKRRLNCPGSLAMEQKAPKKESSAAAKQGTEAHGLLEIALGQFTGKKLSTSIVEESLTKSLKFIENLNYPHNMLEAINVEVRGIAEVLKQYQPPKIFVETRVMLSETLRIFGTCDLFFGFKQNDRKMIFIRDFKYGTEVEVDPATDPQPIGYGLGAETTVKAQGIAGFICQISQPRLDQGSQNLGRDKLKTVVFSRAEADDWKLKILNGVERAWNLANNEEQELELQAGDHCMFCAAKPICETYRKHLAKNSLDFPEEVPATIFSEAGIPYIPDDKLLSIYKASGEIKKFLLAVEGYLINRALDGDPVGDTKAVAGRASRKFKKDIDMVSSSLKALGLEDSQIYDLSLQGIGKIEGHLKKLKIKDPKAAISELVEMTTPGVKLALASDKRAGILRADAPALDFAEIESPDDDE